MKQNVYVEKASGHRDEYDPEKLRRSLKKSGAAEEVIESVVGRIEELIYDDIPTSVIYAKAYSLLKSKSRLSASRYGLKKAVLELGPTGYPFEYLVAELLKADGFEVNVGEIVKGHCVEHEVDVVARKKGVNYLVECKYHSESSRFCNVKIPLYIQSRFDDIDKRLKNTSKQKEQYQKGWIYTNTRFSDDALQYGKCMGLNLISWKYPVKGNLENRIRLNGLYPVTCLNSLSIADKKTLIKKNVVTAKDILHDPELLKRIGVKSKSKKTKVLREIKALCDQL